MRRALAGLLGVLSAAPLALRGVRCRRCWTRQPNTRARARRRGARETCPVRSPDRGRGAETLCRQRPPAVLTAWPSTSSPRGWNWHRWTRSDDYYVFKYLPLGSTSEERGSYRGEDKIGAPQDFRVQWRTDYFFAFDNPYDFYPRDAGDDVGFAAEVALPADDAARLARGDLRMAIGVRLAKECLSDSTTFWKRPGHARRLHPESAT
jgi:hypothetical protein